MTNSVQWTLLGTLLAAISAGAFWGIPAAAAQEAAVPSIIVIANKAELAVKFCNADKTIDHVLVMPSALFVDSDELICPVGPFKLYRIREHNDPDDFEYYLDPPFGTTARLACDGKAGVAMPIIGMNCRALK